MISILSNFRQRTGTRGHTVRHDVGCNHEVLGVAKPTLTTTAAVLDHSTTVGQNLESVNMSNLEGSSWVANPRGLKNLNSISIAVSGIKANDSTIAISPIVYTKSISSQFNVKRNNTAGISNIAISEGTDAIYDLNGNNVGNNVSSLEKGIYILNGKKFIVK